MVKTRFWAFKDLPLFLALLPLFVAMATTALVGEVLGVFDRRVVAANRATELAFLAKRTPREIVDPHSTVIFEFAAHDSSSLVGS